MVGFILWTFTVIAGAIWAKEAWGAYWQWDPKEVWSFVIWTVYAAYMHGRATAGVDLRKSTYIALAGFVSVILNFTLVNLVSTFAGMHNYSGM
jgi:ABC-type transport system involved in cytochrome c biogenesis permease subunit